MKTKRSLFDKVQTEIEYIHSYEVPEIVMVPLAGANRNYLQWLEEETTDH